MELELRGGGRLGLRVVANHDWHHQSEQQHADATLDVACQEREDRRQHDEGQQQQRQLAVVRLEVQPPKKGHNLLHVSCFLTLLAIKINYTIYN